MNNVRLAKLLIKNMADVNATILETLVVHCDNNLAGRLLSEIFERKSDLYNATGLWKKWVKEYHTQEKWLQTFLKAITVFQRRVSSEEKAANDFINALGLAKKLKKKQTFKLLLNYAVISHDLKKILPVELVANIVSF